MAKIIILGSAYPLRAGGLSTFNERLAQEYQNLGHDVTIFNFSLQYPKIFFPGKTQYATRPAPKHLSIKIRVNSINPFNWIKVGNEIKKIRPDLLVIRYWIPFMAPSLATIAFFAKLNKKTKAIAITDNIVPHEKIIGYKILTRYFISNMDGFVTLSKSVLKQLEELERKNKPKVFSPHPLYDNFGKPIDREKALKNLNLSAEYRYILFFGFIRKYKGLDILLNAMASDLVYDMKIKLIVAGEFYVSEIEYLNIIKQKGLGSKVIMHTHFIQNEEVIDYFCASDLVVQPYRDASQSGVTQVAYHFNKPMVVTNVGALPEMVPNEVAGLVVDPDATQVAAAIHRFFTKNMDKQLQEGVIAQKDRFTWDKLVNAVFSAAKLPNTSTGKQSVS